jgi:hypothetical protein
VTHEPGTHRGNVYAVAFFPDGEWAAASGEGAGHHPVVASERGREEVLEEVNGQLVPTKTTDAALDTGAEIIIKWSPLKKN